MKKLIFPILIFICLGAFTVKGQDYWITIYTPTGVAVEALVRDEFNATDLAFIEQQAANWIKEHKSNAVRIAPASRSYNCHSFAWHYSDGGSKVWVNQIAQTNQANLSKYWTGSFQTYVSTNNIEGQKVFYPNGDHSARTTSTPGIFESKWGPWPRYRHAWNDCPYTSTGLQYYKVNLLGVPVVCFGSTGSFSTLNIANGTYNWSGTNLNLSGSSHTASATPTIQQGYGKVMVSVYSPKSKTTVKATNAVWIGIPLFQIVSNEQYEPLSPGIAMIDNEMYDPYSIQIVNRIDWSYTGTLSNFVGDLYKAKFRTGSQPGEGYIYANVYNTCGQKVNSFYYEVVETFKLFLSPNPTSNQVQVIVTDRDAIDNNIIDPNYNVYIVNSFGNIEYNNTHRGKSFTVNVAHIPKGLHTLTIERGNKICSATFLKE